MIILMTKIFETMRLFQIFFNSWKMTNRNVICVWNQKNIVPLIYTRVMVHGPVNGRNQSNFNLHISQMQKQVGRAARNGIFSLARQR